MINTMVIIRDGLIGLFGAKTKAAPIYAKFTAKILKKQDFVSEKIAFS